MKNKHPPPEKNPLKASSVKLSKSLCELQIYSALNSTVLKKAQSPSCQEL